MALSWNEQGSGKDALKFAAWGFYLFIYLCPALFKKDLRQLMKIHKNRTKKQQPEAASCLKMQETEGHSKPHLQSEAAATASRVPGAQRDTSGPH